MDSQKEKMADCIPWQNQLFWSSAEFKRKNKPNAIASIRKMPFYSLSHYAWRWCLVGRAYAKFPMDWLANLLDCRTPVKIVASPLHWLKIYSSGIFKPCLRPQLGQTEDCAYRSIHFGVVARYLWLSMGSWKFWGRTSPITCRCEMTAAAFGE